MYTIVAAILSGAKLIVLKINKIAGPKKIIKNPRFAFARMPDRHVFASRTYQNFDSTCLISKVEFHNLSFEISSFNLSFDSSIAKVLTQVNYSDGA